MELIEKTEGVLGGKARITGTRIAVVDVIEQLKSSDARADIKEQYGLSDEELDAVERYYRRHTDEIKELIEQRRQAYDRLIDQSKA